MFGLSAQDDGTVVMTGGSFTSPEDAVTTQPQMTMTNNARGRTMLPRPAFDDTLSERDWKSGMFSCEGGNSSSKFCSDVIIVVVIIIINTITTVLPSSSS